MSDRLPPLTALRAFEAAARHMSFAKAADELNVTPAALSYQIKALEANLGQPVFRRLNRAVELTEAGRCLAPGATDAFTTLSSAWRSTKRLTDSGVLTVTAGPAFTSKWLAPRMYDFAQAHEDIDLRFSATLRIVDFNRDEVDVAIRFGLGGDESVYSRPIFDEWMTPMMSPQLAKEYDTPAKLAQATFIHDDSINFLKLPTGWDAWLKAAKIEADTSHGPRFSQADHAIDAAVAGAGVVMGRASLVARALEEGQLVAPFEIGLISQAHYSFVCPLGNERRPHIAAFEAWVLKEIQTSKRIAEGRTLINASDLL
ncbi:transcriptional regulator GcvA [Roseobacter sp. CCS2]|uniref:transcriptional regulator GcvA n=1 Tax=Roseobacter sp. CCS2 TaxID=391593 RepID=UPI0000F40091|nr:transcriptional regulator GcvA [Roseobacter sp. CCS2]EBA13730.1 transcriptional regulator, LysR family protein [Roseobacter sp. CCS2]